MRTLGLLFALLGTGCASTLSTLQTARPVEPKHFELTTGFGFYAPVGTAISLIDQGVAQTGKLREAATRGELYEPTEQEKQDLLTAGIALAVLPPSPSYELSARTGLFKNVDLGFRYSVNALRLDTKVRLFHQDAPKAELPPGAVPAKKGLSWDRTSDLALGLGVSRYMFKGMVFDALEYVHLDDFSRWDLEVPLYGSVEFGEVLKLFGSFKYLYSRTTFDENLVYLTDAASGATGVELRLPTRVDTHFAGVSAGLAVGFRHVHVLFELSGGYTVCNPEVLGQKRSLGGLTLYPAAGLALSL